jgi:hypothetical protein
MLFSHEISLPARVLLRSTPLTAAPVMLEHGPGPASDLGFRRRLYNRPCATAHQIDFTVRKWRNWQTHQT